MTWCILLHTYTYESRSRTPKRIRIYSVIYYIIHIHIITMQRFPKEEDSLLLLFFLVLAYFFSHSKRTLKRLWSAMPHFQPSIFVTFWLFRNTSFGKEKTNNENHAASLFQRGYDSRRERESEAGERGAIKREANGTLSFDFFFPLHSLFITFC